MKAEPVGSIRTIQFHTAEGVSVTTVTMIVTTTVGAGVLLVILFHVLLILCKRMKKSTAVNIPMETVNTPQEPLPNNQVNCVLSLLSRLDTVGALSQFTHFLFLYFFAFL